jgi:cytochrome c biogenesis protein CcmG/thiol:disulfide interchange protein DsbE
MLKFKEGFYFDAQKVVFLCNYHLIIKTMNNRLKTILLFFLAAIFLPQMAYNQNTTEKKMWAKSFLGQEAPELEVEGWIQEPGNLEGKFILVDIWATWCGPCRRGIPELNDWQSKYKDQLVIIGISDETKEKVEPYATENIKYANGYDTQKRVKNALKVTGIPHIIVINPEGIVVWEGFPKLKGYELTAKVLEDLMDE